MELKTLKNLIIEFCVKLRCGDPFDDAAWRIIMDGLGKQADEWKFRGNVPKSIVPYLMDLTDQLSGGNSFADEETVKKTADALLELLDFSYELYDDDDVSND